MCWSCCSTLITVSTGIVPVTILRHVNQLNPSVFTRRLLMMRLHGRMSSIASCLWHVLLLLVYHFLFAVNPLWYYHSILFYRRRLLAPDTNVSSAFAGNLELFIRFTWPTTVACVSVSFALLYPFDLLIVWCHFSSSVWPMSFSAWHYWLDRKYRPQYDLQCVWWDVKPYSTTTLPLSSAGIC